MRVAVAGALAGALFAGTGATAAQRELARRAVPRTVEVPAGVFVMGAKGGPAHEKPPHEVRVEAFRMAVTETTLDAWRACAEAGACRMTSALEQLSLLDRPRPLDLFAVRDRLASAVVTASGWPVR